MRRISIALLMITLFVGSLANEKSSAVKLKFNSQGQFKIVQFTDIHFNYNTPRSDSVLTLIKTILAEEKPDLVVITGDVVCSKNTRLAWLQVTQPFIDAKTPWTVTLGNHDDEGELTRKQIIDLIRKLPYCVTIKGPANINGCGNYIVNIHGSQSSKTAALLYCVDSNAYSFNADISDYDWIKADQIDWYRKKSEKLTKANGNNPYPALAFFHIPIPEYKEILTKRTTAGASMEFPTSPRINSGMFTAMIEKKDVMGVFVGHDHDDNFIGCLHNICLAYGCKTGLDSYGKLEKGARVIKLFEGERKFDTWIRTMDKQPKYFVTYPISFTEDKK